MAGPLFGPHCNPAPEGGVENMGIYYIRII